YALCAWGIYYNYNIRQNPEFFHPPQPYETMCWPQLPGLWADYITPPRYTFENYYPENYLKTSVFCDIPKEPSKDQLNHASIEKQRRLRMIEIRAEYPPPLPGWKVNTLRRRLTNRIIKLLLTIDHERFLPERKRNLKIKYKQPDS
ncbi:MAG: hypothetical protein AAFQ02_12975, partial [Bacteroidota bacterium]